MVLQALRTVGPAVSGLVSGLAARFNPNRLIEVAVGGAGGLAYYKFFIETDKPFTIQKFEGKKHLIAGAAVAVGAALFDNDLITDAASGFVGALASHYSLVKKLEEDAKTRRRPAGLGFYRFRRYRWYYGTASSPFVLVR